jgi:hypothetical protein
MASRNIGQPDIIEQGHGHPDLDLLGGLGRSIAQRNCHYGDRWEEKLRELHLFHSYSFLSRGLLRDAEGSN